MTDAPRPIEDASSPQTVTERLALAEMQVIFNQMHTRMNIVAQLMNSTVALAAAVIAGAIALVELRQSDWAFLLFPLPFFTFALLILREDFHLASHDRYWYELRGRLCRAAGATPDDLRFLPFIKGWKVGGASTFLSALRYVAPAVAAIVCFLWGIRNLDRGRDLWLKQALIGLDALALLILVGGMCILGRQHAANERYRRQVEGSATDAGNDHGAA